MDLSTIHTLTRIRAYAAQCFRSGAVAQIPGLIVALPNAAALPKRHHKIFDLLANFTQRPALSAQ